MKTSVGGGNLLVCVARGYECLEHLFIFCLLEAGRGILERHEHL